MNPDDTWIARYMLRDGLTEGAVARILGVSIEAVMLVVPLRDRLGKRISPAYVAAADRSAAKQRQGRRDARARLNQPDPAQGVEDRV
jgi:hypothetical protein